MPSSETQVLKEEEDVQKENLVPEKLHSDEVSKVELKKTISLANGVGLIVGTIIGAGIFISPAGVLSNAGSIGLTMCVWFACGIIASLGALCYCELGTTIPRTGGEYAYFTYIFGPIPAFLVSWTAILIVKPAAIAAVSMVFGQYVTKPFYPDCEPPSYLVKIFGFSSIGESSYSSLFLFCFS